MYVFRICLHAVFASMVIEAVWMCTEIAAAESTAVITWKTALKLHKLCFVKLCPFFVFENAKLYLS